MTVATSTSRGAARPPISDLVLLWVAVAAVSTSAPLVRGAHAPALAVAFWRTVMALPVTGSLLLRSRSDRLALRQLDRRTLRRTVLAGVLLSAHFAAWIPSLSFTSVASAVALVSTIPVWTAVIARWQGRHVPRAVWWGIGVALVGVLSLTGVDLALTPRAMLGDLLALLGGILAAGYLTVGGEVRQQVSTAVYTTVCYAVAAIVLLAICGVGRQPLVGYEPATWLAIVAITIGPQLLGHTLFNRVLRTISATMVSVVTLFEIVGSALLAWVFFDEVPPVSAVPAGVLIVAGVVMVIRSGAVSGQSSDSG
jgi:drug/metabolite transporter (DMT)-like permease